MNSVGAFKSGIRYIMAGGLREYFCCPVQSGACLTEIQKLQKFVIDKLKNPCFTLFFNSFQFILNLFQSIDLARKP